MKQPWVYMCSPSRSPLPPPPPPAPSRSSQDAWDQYSLLQIILMITNQCLLNVLGEKNKKINKSPKKWIQSNLAINGKQIQVQDIHKSSSFKNSKTKRQVIYFHFPPNMAFPCDSAGKESACNVGDLGSIPGLGRSPGEGKGYPL